MPNEENLKNGKATRFRSGDNAVRNGRKGGIASGKVRNEKKAAADYMKMLLDMKAPSDHAKKLKEMGFKPTECTNAAALSVSVVQSAAKGNSQAARLAFELAEKAELKAEQETAAENADSISMTSALETIAPHFLQTMQKLLLDWKKPKQELTEIVEKGGRGSTKSSFCACAIVAALEAHPDIHAVVLRRYGNTLRDSVHAQLQWAVAALGVSEKYKFTTSPMECVNRKTGQKILFYGLDDPNKLKSIKLPFGYIGVLWFEELDQFAGAEQIRNVEQSCLRGGEFSLTLKSFNPPAASRNWANQYVLQQKNGQLVEHTSFKTVPPEWLGERFIMDAEHLKNTNPVAYAHEYEGEVTGSGRQVFDNLHFTRIDDSQIKTFDRIYSGVDWGWYPDPWAWNRVYFDTTRKTLYVFDELTRNKTSNADTAQMLIERGVMQGETDERLTADSAEPKSCADYNHLGVKCIPAIKGAGSVKQGVKWMQSIDRIVIDPVRCPDTAKEFGEYEYDIDPKTGDILPGYPDHSNHHIDAIRYALEVVWRKPERRT